MSFSTEKSIATQLLEQALEALVESRDDVATAIHLVPSYTADVERRVAEATKQLDKHETAIKDIEAYLRSKPAKRQVEKEYTYASSQATECAQCGEHKHTPLRIDAMDGYVCLTCIDKKLGSLLGEFGYPPNPAKQQVEQEPIGTVRQANGCTYVEWNHVPPEAGTVCYAAPQAQEPIHTTGAPLIFAIGLINSDLTLIENIKTREDLNVVIKSIRDQLQVILVYANRIITPQAREPMSEDKISKLHESITHQHDLAGDEIVAFARAIEAHHSIK